MSTMVAFGTRQRASQTIITPLIFNHLIQATYPINKNIVLLLHFSSTAINNGLLKL